MSITERIVCFLAVCPWALIWFLLAHYLRRHPQQSAQYLIISRAKLESLDVKKVARFVSSAMFAGLPFILLLPWASGTKLYYPLQFGLPTLFALLAILFVFVFEKPFRK